MLEDNPAPPADSSVTTRLDPSYLVAIEKTLVQEDSGRIGDKGVFPAASVPYLFHEHIVGDYRTDSSTSEHSSALRREGPDQVQIIFVARKKTWIIERSVEVRRRRNDQRDLAISDLRRSHFSKIAEEDLETRDVPRTSVLGIHCQATLFWGKPSLKQRVYTMTHDRENHAGPKSGSCSTVSFASDR